MAITSNATLPVELDDMFLALDRMRNIKQTYEILTPGYEVREGKLYVSDAFLAWKASQE